MVMGRLRILVASPTERGAGHMTAVLNQFEDLQVISTATDLRKVTQVVETNPPDLVLLSQKFRGGRDAEVLLSLLDDKDIRWLELASRAPMAGQDNSSRWNAAGLFEIDASTPPPMLAQHIRSVCRNTRSPHKAQKPRSPAGMGRHPLHDRIVLIGASTGGVDCLIQVLESYHLNCPPTLIVQHTGSEFISSLITLLDRRSPVPVVPSSEGQPLVPGQVAVAANGLAHLELSTGNPIACRIVSKGPISGHRPSVDALFHSALPLAKRVVAVLLTGMGRDGAAGMLELHKMGATTIAQDKSSSVVYGMPRVAQEMGAVDHVMPMAEIAGVLNGSRSLPKTSNGALT